jgi:hypothetical protein
MPRKFASVPIYVYQNGTPSVAIGDKVTFTGQVVSYYGMPEIINPTTTTVSNGNTVNYPEPNDITSSFDSYTQTYAEYISFTATIVKNGNYTNFQVEGASTYVGFLSQPLDTVYNTLTEGKKVKIYGFYNGRNTSSNLQQVILVKYEILDDGTGGGGTGGGTAEQFASNIEWTNGDHATDTCHATVNGVSGVNVYKLGTSNNAGTATITIPKGTKKVSYYAVAWKSKPTKISIQYNGSEVYSQDVAANDGATNNSPYTLTVSDSDHYEFDLTSVVGSSGLPADLTATVTTSGEYTRILLFGMKAE